MSRNRILLAALVLASVVGTLGLLTAGSGGAVLDLLRLVERHRATLAIVFGLWALLANCLVLPAGSLSLIAGGAALGALLPAAIWFVAQLLTAPLLYRAGNVDHARVDAVLRRYLGSGAATLVEQAARDGIWTTAALRLTPVLPSAPAALIAAAAGIELRSFMIGSLLAGWLRPLYFAGLGATVGSLSRVGSSQAALSLETIWPPAVVGACAAAMLAWRLLRGRRAPIAPAAAEAPLPGD